MTERKAFEKHMKHKYGFDIDLERFKYEYMDSTVLADYKLWQSACAYQRENDAVIVEGLIDDEGDRMAKAYNLAINLSAKTIRNQNNEPSDNAKNTTL